MIPESPALRAIERVRITELLAAQGKIRGGQYSTRTELAEALFPAEDLGRPRHGVSRPLSTARKRALVSEWDRGRMMTALKPRHLLRLARFFNTTDVHHLVEFAPEQSTFEPEPNNHQHDRSNEGGGGTKASPADSSSASGAQ